MKYIRKVVAAVDTKCSTTLPIKYVFVRFIATALAQVTLLIFSPPTFFYYVGLFTVSPLDVQSAAQPVPFDLPRSTLPGCYLHSLCHCISIIFLHNEFISLFSVCFFFLSFISFFFLPFFPLFLNESKGTHTSGPMLDALVMILGNTEFTNWFWKKFAELQISWRTRKELATNQKSIMVVETSASYTITAGTELVIITNDAVVIQ